MAGRLPAGFGLGLIAAPSRDVGQLRCGDVIGDGGQEIPVGGGGHRGGAQPLGDEVAQSVRGAFDSEFPAAS
jgi:hypothetical protein